jgi:hypothetical protein
MPQIELWRKWCVFSWVSWAILDKSHMKRPHRCKRMLNYRVSVSCKSLDRAPVSTTNGSVSPREERESQGRRSASSKSLVVYQSWSWKTNLLQPNFSLPKSLIIEVFFHFDQHNHGRLLVTGIVSQETSPHFLLSLSNSIMRFSSQRILSYSQTPRSSGNSLWQIYSLKHIC